MVYRPTSTVAAPADVWWGRRSYRTLALDDEETCVDDPEATLRATLGLMFRAHPWHGVAIGPDSPEIVNVYIEIVPTDTVKYELDKATGNLKVDRPQKYSNICPTLYGFIPQTLCAERVAERIAPADRPRRHRRRRRPARHLRADREAHHARRHPAARDPDRRASA